MTRTTPVLVGIVLIAIAGGFALAATGVDAQENDAMGIQSDKSTVHVTGSAETTTTPDRATVRLAVIARADTADDARTRVAERASSMRSALREAGIEDERAQTTYYDISAIHEERQNGTEITGYRAAHGFEIEVDASADTLGERTGTIVDTAVQNGANQIDGVQFSLSEETRRSMRQETLELAMDNAREDADTLASAGDLTITGVSSVSTTDAGVSPYEFAREGMAGGAADTGLEPGAVRVSATVSVTYHAE